MSKEKWLQVRATYEPRYRYSVPISTDPEFPWPSISADGVRLPIISLVDGGTIRNFKQTYARLDFTLEVSESELHPCAATSNNPRITPNSFADLCSLIALPGDYRELYHGGHQVTTGPNTSTEPSSTSVQAPAWPTSDCAPLPHFMAMRLRADMAKTIETDVDRIFSHVGADDIVPLTTPGLSKRQKRKQALLAQERDQPSEGV